MQHRVTHNVSSISRILSKNQETVEKRNRAQKEKVLLLLLLLVCMAESLIYSRFCCEGSRVGGDFWLRQRRERWGQQWWRQ